MAPSTHKPITAKFKLSAIPAATRQNLLRRSLCPRLQNKKYATAIKAVANAVFNDKLGKWEEYRHLIKGEQKIKWQTSGSKEFGRLSDGSDLTGTPGTQCVKWLHPNKLPPGKRATYLRIVASHRPQKKDPDQVRGTIGGNRVIYHGPTQTPTVDITTFKLLANSIISTPNAKFIDADIADFYLMTIMKDPEYMLIPYKLFPPDIIEQYNLANKLDNGHVLAKIVKGRYGLPQAGQLAYDQLKEHLAKADYHATPITPGLFLTQNPSNYLCTCG